MRVGIDARLLSERVTGIGRYTAELTKELVKLDDTFFLYSPQELVVGSWQQPNVTVRAADFRNRVGRMYWSQSYLPYWASKDRLDVFWGATHRLPRYLPASVARVVTIHDLVYKHAGDTMRPLSRWVEKRLLPEAVRLADLIVADSQSTSKDLQSEYPEVSQRIKVVYPGVSALPQALERETLTLMGVVKPYFLFVGTLEPRKNLRRLLSAYAKIDEAVRCQYQMVIAGGKGWGDVDLSLFIREAGLEEQVVVTGYLDDTQLSTFYAHALFIAMPSLYEGFGLPIVEAMSHGVPVLTSNTSSMPEVAGDAGLLVNPFSELSIANGLSKLLINVNYRETLANRASANAKRFSWQSAAKDLRKIFDQAIQVRNTKQGKANL